MNNTKNLRFLFGVCLTMFALMFVSMAFADQPAQVPAVVAVAPVDPTVTFLQLLIQSLGGMKGASLVVIVGLSVQLVLKLLDLTAVENLLGKAFSDWSGHVKLIVISGLTLVGGISALMTAGHLSLGAALVHSTTLTAFTVFANQVYQQFFQKKAA